MARELTETVPVKVDRATKDALVRLAAKNDRSVSAVARAAIRSYLQKEGKR